MGDDVVQIGATAKVDACNETLGEQVKPIFDEAAAFLKQSK